MVFTIAILAISILLIASIIGILTGKFQPFADVRTGFPRRTVALPRTLLNYTDISGTDKITRSNESSIVIAPYPSAEIAQVQGLAPTVINGLSIPGTINAKNTTTSATVFSGKSWTALGGADGKLKTVFTEDDIIAPLDSLQAGYNVSFLLKPENSLAVKVQGVTNIDTPLQLPKVVPGDLDVSTAATTNKIDDKDFLIWRNSLGAPVTAANQKFDFNRDGRIDEADYAIIFSEYYNTSGDALN